MEHEEDLPVASLRKHSDTEASPNDNTFPPQSMSNFHPLARPRLENRAIELYCEVLLSRAHFLFFNSVRVIKEEDAQDDEDDEARLFNEARKIFEKAESICMSGRGSVSDRLLAKCWYVKGFCADISGDKQNAHKFFEDATALDGKYRGFDRVEYYLASASIPDGLDEAWRTPSRSSKSRKRLYRFGEPDSAERPARRASVDSHETRGSELFSTLMIDVEKLPPSAERNPGEAVRSPPTTPTHVRHLLPLATPPHAEEFEFDTVIDQIREAPSKAATREPSKAILITLGQHANTPEKDESLLLTAQRQAELEAAERKKCAGEARRDLTMRQWREDRHIQSPKRIRLPTTQEILLSDTPSVEELDTRNFSPTDRSFASSTSPTMTVTTQGISKLSGSPASATTSPVTSSPLRKSSLPGGRDSDESSGS